MDKGKIYAELIAYIFQYCEAHFLEAERIAYRHFRALDYAKAGNSKKVYQSYMAENQVADNAVVKALIAGGYGAFSYKVARRVLYEHAHELQLNLCPECGKIARTPQAKQCRFCFHDWH